MYFSMESSFTLSVNDIIDYVGTAETVDDDDDDKDEEEGTS